MKGGKQTTLRKHAAVFGIGVHSSLSATLTIHPAEADSGIVFVRAANSGAPEREVRADFRAVTATEFQTVLGDAKGALCQTTEHVLAALRGVGIDNAVIELDGPEAPIMDGSAAPFVAAIDQAGIVTLNAPRRYIEVLKPVRAGFDKSVGELRPYNGFRVEAEIDFPSPVIGRQAVAFDIDANTFRTEIAGARTFGFMRDVAKLWGAGYALGASFENTLVVAEDRVLNPNGLRYPDEFVRHKVLDALGDLYLLGSTLIAEFSAYKCGHKLNNLLLRRLLEQPDSYEEVVFDGDTQRSPVSYQLVPSL
jgi:UDP-3-O-[3-hydroxymyristoyl] N-acetylglucosamine deacetylase